MINQPTAGLDPNGYAIGPSTPDLPGFFLSKEAARRHLAEYPDRVRRHYSIVERSVRANRWNLAIWVAVPVRWAYEQMRRAARALGGDR